WIPIWLFGVEDFEHSPIARFFPEEGSKVPPAGTLFIERNGKLISDLRLGSTASLRVGTRRLSVPVSGIVFDPAQAPATQDHFIYAYTDPGTFAAISGKPSGERLIYRVKDAHSIQEVERVNERVIENFRLSGISVRSSVVPKFNEHPHQWQLNTLLFLIGSIGLLAFLMAAVLVSQLMSALMARQVRQIGILKAIGASPSRVLEIYFWMLLFLGLASSALAIPLALASGYGFSIFVSQVLNFEILTRTLPWFTYAALLTSGILLPLLFSLPAIWKGVRLPVREALADEGVANTQGSPKTTRVRWPLPPGILMAVRNSVRRKKRLSLTVLAMGLGVAIFLTGFNVRKSLWQFLSDIRTGMRHDVQVVLNAAVPPSEALAAFGKLSNVEGVELWSGGRGELQSQKVSTLNGVGIVALPAESRLLNLPLVSGRWLKPSENPEVVMNQQALSQYGNPPVGSLETFTISGKTIRATLVGVVEEFEKPKIYIAQNHYDDWVNPSHRVNSLMFVAKDKGYQSVLSLKKNIEHQIEDSSLDVLYVMSQAERVKIIYDHLNIILSTILILAFSVLSVGGLGMASATGINIMERTREIGVMRAIGATPRRIHSLFVSEGMIVVGASLFLGLLLAWPLSFAASRFFG
ncbi:MAG: FtsX-like permease family protein, partial [Spirochaetia bacterium]|nr:FtsX-like permease family protein [Spirochaetia bacterium]